MSATEQLNSLKPEIVIMLNSLLLSYVSADRNHSPFYSGPRLPGADDLSLIPVKVLHNRLRKMRGY